MVIGILCDFGGGEDELDVRGRLFERLEEGVEGARREHVHLVDDHDLEAVARGPVRQRLLQPAHVVDAVVGGAVDLEHVEVDAGGDLFAGVADVARLGRGTELAVERLGEQACAGRLADAAHAREQERVRDATAGDRVRERARDVLLSDLVSEGLRTILTRENRVAHGRPAL